MRAIVERKTSHAAFWSRRVGWFCVVLLLVAAVAHRYGLLETPPFLWVLALVAALALLALLLAAVGLFRLWQIGARGGGAAAAGLLLALIVLAPFGVGAFRYFAYPKLTDISTDLVNPPRFVVARLNRPADMNPITLMTPNQALEQSDFYPSLTGRRYALPVALVLASIQDLMAQRGWSVERPAGTQLDTGEATIEAVASSLLLGLKSDVAIRLTNEGDTVYVDMRSVSRYGNHDLGTNAATVESFLGDLDDAVVKRALTAPPDPES